MRYFKNEAKINEISKMTFSNTQRTDCQQTYNSRAISLFDCEEMYFLTGDKTLTNVQSHLTVQKSSGVITETNENLNSDTMTLSTPQFYSGFLGVINIMGCNFLMFVKEVKIFYILDGCDKIYEIASLEFKRLSFVSMSVKNCKKVDYFKEYIDKYVSSGGYYFSYTYPLTLSQQKMNQMHDIPELRKPYFHLIDIDFLWNHHLLKPLIQHKISGDWQPQLIQGNVYNFILGKDSQQMLYTVISRRQHIRGGTRYSHRGVDSNGFVANFVETEQIIVIPSLQRIISHVQIRGSVPSYWSQRGISAKLVLESSRQLSDQACSLHFDYLKKHYTTVVCVNLMSDTKSDEKKLTKEFQTLLLESSVLFSDKEEMVVNKSCKEFVNYYEFDFHREVKKERFENIDKFIIQNTLSDMQQHGFFLKAYKLTDISQKDPCQRQLSMLNCLDVKIVQLQRGVIRTNCLDCLDRTNFFQLRTGFNALTKMVFPYLGVDMKGSNGLDVFQKYFQYSWGMNGDKISLHYAGTKATTSMVAKKGKSGMMGFLEGKFTSAKRFFKGTLTDSYKQQCYCILLGEHYESEENLLYQEILLKNLKIAEPSFTTLNSVTIFAVSWSVNSFQPDEKCEESLNDIFKMNRENSGRSYKLVEKSETFKQNCDVVVISLQEIVELSSQNFLKSSDKKYKAVRQLWREVIHKYIGGEGEYFFVDSHHMAGIITYVFARQALQDKVSSVEYDSVTSQIGGQIFNKGAVAFRFCVDDTSIVIINCHLQGGKSNITERMSSINYIHKQSFQQEGMASYKRDPISKSDKIILMGNLNFRVDKKSSDCKESVQEVVNLQKINGQWISLLQEKILCFDQLRCLQNSVFQKGREKTELGRNYESCSQTAIKYAETCPHDSFLYNYYEKNVQFVPTYKLKVGTDEYENSWKQRVPSYADRILIWDQEGENVNVQESFIVYDSCNTVKYSDHKPIYAILSFGIKQIDYVQRDRIVEDILFQQSVKEEDFLGKQPVKKDDQQDNLQGF